MTDDKIHIGQDFYAHDFAAIDLTGHKFIACNLSYSRINETTKIYGTSFHGCTMHYLNSENVFFDRVTFSYCDAMFADFKKSTFNHSQATWTNFGGGSFKEADAYSLMTSNCDFFTSRIQHAKRINPYSRDMISEILRIEAKDDLRKLECAAFIKNSPDICWRDFVVLANTDHYKPIAKEIMEVLIKQGTVSERNLERYKTHDVID